MAPGLTVLHVSDLQCGKPFVLEAADAMVRVADAVSPDLVVVAGDLTQRAKVHEYEMARRVLHVHGGWSYAIPLIAALSLSSGYEIVESWAARKLPRFSERLVLRPGLTGWAQITQGYAADGDEVAYSRKLGRSIRASSVMSDARARRPFYQPETA